MWGRIVRWGARGGVGGREGAPPRRCRWEGVYGGVWQEGVMVDGDVACAYCAVGEGWSCAGGMMGYGL